MIKNILAPVIIVILGSIVIAAYGYFYLFIFRKMNLPVIINIIIILIIIALIAALIVVFIQRIKEFRGCDRIKLSFMVIYHYVICEFTILNMLRLFYHTP
ncbi:MAG: hypothetical protein L6422_04205 [Candidatus Marinimicrobia bacterium]|nr:hypothetical protein [Candidatus Neomarinimicrobiota bacterium]